MKHSKDLARIVFLRPYVKGKGPIFAVKIYDLHKVDNRNSRRYIEATLTAYEFGKSKEIRRLELGISHVLYEPNSDGAVKICIDCLTYIDANDSEELCKFMNLHGDYLKLVAEDRFPDKRKAA